MKLRDFLKQGPPRTSSWVRFYPKHWEQPTYKSKMPPWWTISVKNGYLKVKYVRGGEIWLEEIIRLEGMMKLVPDLETEGWAKSTPYGYDLFFCKTYPMKRGGFNQSAP